MKVIKTVLAPCLILALAASSFAVDIIDDDFSSGTISHNLRFRISQADAGWYQDANSLWNITNGVLTNPGTAPGIPAEGPVGQSVLTAGLAEGLDEVTVSFDYSVGAGSTLYFHLLGFTTNGTPDSAEILANTQPQNGVIQNQGEVNFGDMNILNGGDPGGGSGDAVSFAATSGTYTETFNLTHYTWSADESPGLTGDIADVKDFDVILAAFASNVTTNDGTGAISISNLTIRAKVNAPMSYYVSPTGNDSGEGTLEDPFETMSRACQFALPGDTVYLRGGVYTETLTPPISGTSEAPITFSCYEDETVELVSGQRLTNWVAVGDGSYTTSTSIDYGIGANQLICNDDLMMEARYPNIDSKEELIFTFLKRKAMRAYLHQTSKTSYDPTDYYEIYEAEDLPTIAGSAFYVGIHNGGYATQMARFTCTTQGILDILYKTQYLSFSGEGTGYVVGAPEYLDHPKEWVLDAGMISFIPPTGVDPNSATIYQKNKLAAIDLSNRSHIIVQGVNTRIGSVNMTDSHYCVIRDSTHLYGGHHTFPSKNFFADSSYADEQSVFWDSVGFWVGGVSNRIERCEVAYSSGAAIAIVGKGQQVFNNRFHDTGLQGSYSSGILVYNYADYTEQLGGHEIASNTVYNVPRSAIHLSSTGTWAAPEPYPNPLQIHHNELANAMLMGRDGGAIYHFCNDGNGSEIAYNVVRDTRATGIYNDNYSRGFNIHHNVIYQMHDAAHIKIGGPVGGSERMKLYNNTILDETAFAGCYDTLVADNIAPTWGTHAKGIDFAGAGSGGSQFKPLVASQVPQGYYDADGQTDFTRLSYSGAFDPAEPAWQAGADWGGSIPPIQQVARKQLWACTYTDASGFRNNAGHVLSESSTAWLNFDDVDFGEGYSQLMIRAMVESGATGTVSVRTGSSSGTLLGSTTLVANSDTTAFEYRCINLSSVQGVQDLYLVLNATPGVRIIEAILIGAKEYPSFLIPGEDDSDVLTIAEGTLKKGGWIQFNLMKDTSDGNWMYFPQVNFGPLCNQALVTISLPYGREGGVIEFRSGSPDGTLLGEHAVQGTGDAWGETYEEQAVALNNVSGVHDVFMVFKNKDCGHVGDIRLLAPITPITPISTVTSFTGGDVGEGIELSGDYVYALDIAGQNNSTLQGQTFSPSTGAAGVTITQGGNAVFRDWETSPEYGTSENDNTLESMMHAAALSWGDGKYTEIDLAVTSGVDYELQLFFSENDKPNAAARHFDIAVEGETIADEFTPGPTGSDWTDAPHMGVLVTYQFTAGDGVLDIDLTPGASGETSPVIQGLTLKDVGAQLSAYEQWGASFLPVVIGSETNDYDGDLKDNFYEYVFIGDPTNPAVIGMSPVFEYSDADLVFIYAQRANDASLNYELEACTNLVFGSWTNFNYVVLGTNDTGGAFSEVTNRIPVSDPQLFIRLKVTQ